MIWVPPPPLPCAGGGAFFPEELPLRAVFLRRRERSDSFWQSNQKPLQAGRWCGGETIHGYLFMLPSLVFFIGFVIIPMVICVINSLTDANMYTQGLGHFVGLKNFIDLWKDKTFLEALKNTFIIVVVSVPAVTIFSLWVSSAIYKMKGPCSAPSAASSTSRWSPAPWPSPWCGSGCTTTTTASSTSC